MCGNVQRKGVSLNYAKCGYWDHPAHLRSHIQDLLCPFLYFTVLCAKSIPDFQSDLDFAVRIYVEERFVIVDDNAISLIPYSRHKAELQ